MMCAMRVDGQQWTGRVFDSDTPPTDPDELWEFLDWWWNVRLPQVREMCVTNLAEARRLREDYARKTGRISR